MICNKCGNKSDDDSVYCSKCGAKFDYPETQNEYQVLPKKGMNTSTKIAIIIGISFVVLFGLAYLGAISEYDELATPTDTSSSNPQTTSSQSSFFSSDAERKKELEQMAITNPLISGLINSKLRYYIEPVPSYASSDIHNAVKQVSNALDDTYLHQMQFQRVYNENQADLYIQWIKNYGSHVLGESILKRVIKVGLGTDSCYGDWQPFDADSVTKIMIHEVGHSVGYGHSSNQNNIMYAVTDTRFTQDYNKRITLDEGYHWSASFCNAGTYSYSIDSDSSSNGFYVYVITPETNPSSFISGDSGLHYTDCGGGSKNYISFSRSCTVPQGAKLLLNNKDDLFQFSAISLQVQIIDQNQISWPDFAWDNSVFQYDQRFLNEVWNLYH